MHFNVTLKEDKKALGGVFDIKDKNVLNQLNVEQLTKYELRAEAFWAVNLPENDKDYFISVHWANLETKTKEKVFTELS